MLLLDADAKQLAPWEKALADARGDEERLDAVILQLTTRLSAAKRAANFGKISDALERTRTAKAARPAWWQKNDPAIQR
ncbi:hypothetical protein [Roseomonas chloroacetimidivorans]|uniref:hypothetical protein n=1 Tax=Roseomonas chloroacetimidivorans TaxID=1766656 RepID=UPI003C715E42